MKRAILWMILTFFMAASTMAQCTGTDLTGSCASCASAADMTPSCTSCYEAPHMTDLAKTGLGSTATVTINGATFPGISSMTVTAIDLYAPPCNIVPGGPYTASTFPSSAVNIVFTESNNKVTIAVAAGQTIPSAFVGYTVNFTVNVFTNGGATPTASRVYLFKITGTTVIVGDPHITTADGVKYDFQSAGEFTALKGDSSDNFEIQTRHTPVGTSGPGNDGYSGLTTCVSLITAVAAQVGSHRVSYVPNVNGKPDSSGMQLRVDGTLTTVPANGVDLGSGGRIVKASAGAGIEIDFPNGASLVVTSNWWSAYSVWYLNVQIYHNIARRGIMGVIAPKSWLPALADGSSLGPKPTSPHDRFVAIYGKLATSWRVTDKTTLFDYAPGTNTATFTSNWPVENAETCSVQGQTPLPGAIGLEQAQQLARDITDPGLKANAIFDVMTTGDPTFAKAYLTTQQVQNGTTQTMLRGSKDTTGAGESVTFTATVSQKFAAGAKPTGSVEFTVDGAKADQVKLDANGNATMTTTTLAAGSHQITASYIPDAGSAAFASSSRSLDHTVTNDSGKGADGASLWHQWWFWAIIFIIIIILWLLARKKK